MSFSDLLPNKISTGGQDYFKNNHFKIFGNYPKGIQQIKKRSIKKATKFQ